MLGAIILEMVGYTAPRQHYPFLPRWPGYPAEGNFIGIIGNWRSMRFGRAVLRGFRNNSGLPVESLFLPFDGWILPETRLSDHASFWDAGLPALMSEAFVMPGVSCKTMFNNELCTSKRPL